MRCFKVRSSRSADEEDRTNASAVEKCSVSQSQQVGRDVRAGGETAAQQASKYQVSR